MEPGESSSKPSRHMKNRLQLAILEAAYTVNKTPSAVMKEVVADMTGLTTKEVTAWYGNKRFCERHGPRRKKTEEVQALGPKSVGQPSTIIMSHEESDELLQPPQIQSMPIQQSQHATQARNAAMSLGLEKQSLQLSVDPPVQKQHPHTSATNIQQPNPDPATMNPKEVGLRQKTKWKEPVRVYQRRKAQGIHVGARPTEKATTTRDAKEATSTAGRGKSDLIEVIDLDSE